VEAAEPLREAAVEPLRDVNKSESVQAMLRRISGAGPQRRWPGGAGTGLQQHRHNRRVRMGSESGQCGATVRSF